MKLGYVCTNFNNTPYTIAAIDSLRANAGHQIEIVVVDNASKAPHPTDLANHCATLDGVTAILNDDNLGYFRGLNTGIRALRQAHPDLGWVIIGNNDLVFPTDLVERMADRADTLGRYAVIAPNIVTLDGLHQNPHVLHGISPLRELIFDLYYTHYWAGLALKRIAGVLGAVSKRRDTQAWRQAGEIYRGHGACFILTPRFFELFDELWAPTFLFYEEVFLSKQLGDKGERVYYCPDLEIRHHWHAAFANLPGKATWTFGKAAHREYRKVIPSPGLGAIWKSVRGG